MSNKFLQTSIAAVSLIVPFSTIALINIGVGHLTVGRAYVALVMLIFLVSALVHGKISRPRRLPGVLLAILVLYGILLWASGLWAIDKARAMQYTIFYVWFIAFITLAMFAGAGRATLFLSIKLWGLTSIVVGAIASWEIFFRVRFPGSRYRLEEHPYLFPPTATFHNENDLAIYLGLSGIIILAYSLRARLWISIVGVLLLFWFFVIILHTGSRGATILYLLGIGIFLTGTIFASLRARKWLIVGIVGSIVSLVLLRGTPAGTVFQTAAGDMFQAIGAISLAGEARAILLQYAGNAAFENNGLGVGAGNIEVYISDLSGPAVLAVHNWIFEVVANTGLLGGALWIIFSTGLFVLMLQQIKRAADAKEFEIALVIIFLLFPIWQSIVSSMIQFMAFWTLLMYLLVYVNDRESFEVVKWSGPLFNRTPG